jgi:putative ABC transport system permease protein
VALSSLEGQVEGAVYFPYAKTALPFAVLHARTSGDVSSVMAAVQEEVQALDTAVPVQAPTAIDDVLAQTLWPRRMGAALLSIFAVLALVMAAAGIHAVMSYTSALRRHEIGVRMALGAESARVLWLVLRQGMTLVAIGCVVGIVVTLAAGSLVSGMLYGVEPADPATLFLVPAVLSVVALVACGLPAWRSTQVQPVRALQPEGPGSDRGR